MSAFQGAPDDHTRVAHIDATCPDLMCEIHPVSPHNDVPVGDGEVLVRIVMDPTHVQSEDGQFRLKSSAFSDAASVGSSTLRRAQADNDQYRETAAEMTKNPVANDGTPKKVYGVALVPVSTIKSIIHELEPAKNGNAAITVRALGVYATGLELRPSHADVMVNRVTTVSRSKANRATMKLAQHEQVQLLTAEQFGEADFSDWM